MDRLYRQTPWYSFLNQSMKALVDQSYQLLYDEQAHKKPRFKDYSFLVFPIARAYEGFLKKFFDEAELISRDELMDPHFRIGRSLNPDLPDKLRDKSWLYDNILEMSTQCNQPDLAMEMWQIWRKGRNQIFHYYFASDTHVLDLNEAREVIEEFSEVMSQVIKCKINDQI